MKKHTVEIFIIALLFNVFVQPTQSSTIFVTSSGFESLQFLDENMAVIYMTNLSGLNNDIASLKSGQKITFVGEKLTGEDGTVIETLSKPLGKVNGVYSSVQYKLSGSSDWESLLFKDSFSIALKPSFSTADGQKLMASGETLSSLTIGLKLKSNTQSMTSLIPPQLSAINEELKNKKGVVIKASVDSSGTDFTLTISAITSDGTSVQGFPVTLTDLASATAKPTAIPTANDSLEGQFIACKTSNLKQSLLIQGDQYAFTYSDTAALITSAPPTDTGGGGSGSSGAFG